ncbi:MAG: ferredoxin [Candidatus Eisenbacteria bacterium]
MQMKMKMTADAGKKPFLRLHREICLSCAACVAVCGPGALLLHGLELAYDKDRCEPCADCLRVCPVMALEPIRGTFYREAP